MKPEQTKILLNVAEGVAGVALLVVIYFAFIKKGDTAPVDTAPVALTSLQMTEFIGIEISRKISALETLKNSVADSVLLFHRGPFENLDDLSVSVKDISADDLKKENPFVVTDWKIKMKTSGTQTGQGTGNTSSTEPPLVTSKETSSSQINLLGDFSAKTKPASSPTSSSLSAPKNGGTTVNPKTQTSSIGGDFFVL